MRKKFFILLVIFLAFMIPGTCLQLQKGVMLNDQLWLQTDTNRFELSDSSHITFSENSFNLKLNGKIYTGERIKSENGDLVFKFNDGWSLLMPSDPHGINIAFSIGHYYGGGGGRIRIDDPNRMNLRFVAPGITERYPIMDTNGRQVGETIHVISADGSTTLAFREEWFIEPEHASGPPQQQMVIRSGLELDMYSSDQYVFLNEKGEYLLNPDDLLYLESNGVYLSKALVCSFIDRVMNGQIIQRGSLWFSVLSAVLYVVGALSFLFPRHFAMWGQRWKYTTDVEPSDAYLFMQQAAGVLIMFAAILLLYIPQ